MKSLLFNLLLCLLAGPLALAQGKIKGRVVDNQTNEPLPGVSIAVKGTTTGTATDAEGRFELAVARGQQLVMTHLGFKNLTLTVQNEVLNVGLEPETVSLTEVVVTGYDSRRTILRTPGSIGLVGERDLQRADQTSLTQIMNHIPGVQVRGSNTLRPATISIRGMGARGPGSSGRIKLYLNDLMLTYPDGSNAFEDIDPQTIGRVEVIKGPASSIYGASIGGVVNISTQKPTYGEKSLEGFGMVGSFGTYRFGSTARVANDKVNLMFTYGQQATNGFREFSGEGRGFLTFLGSFQSSPKSQTTLFFNRNFYDSRAPGALTPQQAADNPRQAQANQVVTNSGRRINFTRIGISNEWELAPRLTNITSVTASFSDLDHPTANTYIYNWIQNYGGRTRFVYSPKLGSMQSRFTVGAEFQQGVNRLSFYRNTNGRPDSVRIGDRNSLVANTIGFAQAEFEPTDKLLVTLGASVNFYDYSYIEFTRRNAQSRERAFTPFFAPRLGVNYRITSKIALHGNLSRGFTPPTVGDINQPDGRVNETLNPETAINYELGLRGSALGDRLSFDLAAYRMNLAGEILTRTPAVGFTTRENAGATSYTGVEAFVSWLALSRPGAALSLVRPYASYTYLRSVFEDFVENPRPGVNIDANGFLVPGNAPHRLFAGLEVESGLGFYLFGTYEYTDRTPINNLNTLYNNAFGLLGAKIGWRKTVAERLRLDVYAGGNNLTDEIYADSPALNPNALPSGPQAGQFPFLNLNWGRNFYGGVSARWLFK
jgi:iron complex outermembrane receptor protein